MSELPVEAILPQLRTTLREHNAAVLIAPPGAGKTTRIPLALLEEPWLAGRKLIMLEPRRLAARNAAVWMASQLGESAGQTVGYRMRMESKISDKTRIEVVTEGILTRLLQDDPMLEAYGAVIFDEYHERSLQADLGLALVLDARELREDLRLLVMSATLEGEAVSRLLDGAPLLQSEGRSHEVAIRYLPAEPGRRLETAVAAAVQRALAEELGSLLVFLPGEAEIRRSHEALERFGEMEGVSIHPLYGKLSQAEQEQAIAPPREGQRKIVLASAIAETSLTIEGVRVVIDAGLMRVPRFDPASGMTRLQTLRVSRASAEQRCGRAGRTEPGVCYRLWDEATQAGLVPHAQAEILEADLAPLALELAQWGIQEPTRLAWLDLPPQAAYAQAQELLRSLQALDGEGRITVHGRAMLKLGLHPRLAHMVVRGADMSLGPLACDLAALLGERDPFRLPRDERHADLRTRLEALYDDALQHRYRVDRATLRRVRQTAAMLRRRLGLGAGTGAPEQAGRVLALAYPDRIAGLRPGGNHRYRLSNGKGAVVDELDALAGNPYLVAAELDGQQREARIFLAAPITLEEIEADFAEQIRQQDAIDWDAEAERVRGSRQRRLGQLILEERPLTELSEAQRQQALLSGIRQCGLEVLPWDKESRNWQRRVQFLRRQFPEQGWPDVGDETLLANLEQWLAPYLVGLYRLDQLESLKLKEILSGLLPWEQQQGLCELAPTHIQVPSGSRIAIDYSGEAPVLAVRLQELFGLAETPAIAGGRVPLLLHLLSPARRPMQVTQDLASFWQNTYPEVKKDLKGRYPKHPWPDDPLQAEATHRAKPRKR